MASDKLKPVVPKPLFGSVGMMYVIFTALGCAMAYGLLYVDADSIFLNLFGLENATVSELNSVLTGIIALVVCFLYIPSLSNLIKARQDLNVGHPLHHLAPGELGLSSDDRLLFLSKLRAYENTIEWLPLYMASVYGVVGFGYYGIAFVISITYFIGRVMYGLAYGSGSPLARIPGLVISNFFSRLIAIGIIILRLVDFWHPFL
mmetsp:Transcript_4147/g.6246  ORF Transcript_4147/g.6246 Transcript_4147/m.6246 type:complete len:204 (-) Transcript_4147:180-791(-)|eukprot:CAMPEP_0201552974 /NCGR_PEP_ID=MMETSP0173_2-20130828/19372_1 /ASSEMBLY_ACC=CAM_ASM_000268 /TAXON_ID=218659 /ORGANISM="Vexillifera sp., Strain DIVA3 564/2" /LENGTH=203 /DNA_ID=CAMNT_0047963569 /DNA_START=1 /DNA_END=612 /DNA_ORIENTATION=-